MALDIKSLFMLSMVISLPAVQGYHILCYHPVPSKSHDYLARGIVNSLLKAGHQITWVTPYPEDKPKNVTVIDVSRTQKIVEDLGMENRRVIGFSVVKEFTNNITRVAFGEDLKKALIQNQYDAVVSEWFFSDVEAGLAAAQQVPWILLSGILMHPHMESLVDIVRTIPIIPALTYNAGIPMNFWERLQNTFMYLTWVLDKWYDYSANVATYEAFFKPIAEARGVTLPSYSEAIRNVSIMLVNSHPSFAPAQNLPPNVVEIAGYHIDEYTPPLPKDLQEILDNSPEGVVYFSMGSVLKARSYPEQTKKNLIEVLGSIPYTVLWKYEEKIENLPKNVHVRPWMPQASILAHPNVKVFISHCGLLSTLEALNYGVPILGIPMFGDQPGNAERAVRSGFAVKVDFRPDIKDELRQGLMEMLTNDKYYKMAKYLSMLFRTRPTSPSKLISHYIELAIESKGAYHLRSKTNLYEWYQIWMLDQLAAVIVVLIIIYLIIKKLISFVVKTKPSARKSQKDKKSK